MGWQCNFFGKKLLLLFGGFCDKKHSFKGSSEHASPGGDLRGLAQKAESV
jgi:hypothetical protein